MLESRFNQVVGRGPATLLKRDPTQVFACKICEIFNTFFYRTPSMVASEKAEHQVLIMLCNCLCSSSSPSFSRDFASVIRNIEKFGAKNYFTDH